MILSEKVKSREEDVDLVALNGDIDLIHKFIKLGRIRWTGPVARMDDAEIPRKAHNDELYGIRQVGRPKLRSAGGVSADEWAFLGIRNWRAVATRLPR